MSDDTHNDHQPNMDDDAYAHPQENDLKEFGIQAVKLLAPVLLQAVLQRWTRPKSKERKHVKKEHRSKTAAS